MKSHNKHAYIKRPNIGEFGRMEIGLIGAPCSTIKAVVHQVATELKGSHKVIYVDADHQAAQAPEFSNLTDRISHDRLDFEEPLNDFDRKILLSGTDLILVNANHFKSKKQIVFCTEKKRLSLQKKLDKLTDVGLIILDTDIEQVHDFLQDHISDIDKIPVCKIEEIGVITDVIRARYQSQLPPVSGLVLAGGKSQRMGETKAMIDYHGMPQVSYACQMLDKAGVEPTISCRTEQSDLFADRYPLLHDVFLGLGPFGALLTAFKSNPDTAWLVMACDQPLISDQHLKYLIEHRDPAKIATCFHNPETGFPEPILTLWEPKAYPRLLSFLSLGYSCPRKVLINSDINELVVEDTAFMVNANTQEERKAIMNKL